MLDLDLERRIPIHIAAYRGHFKLIHDWFGQNQVSVDSVFSKDVQGRTVVHYIATGGSRAFLKWLKDIGGKVINTAPDDDGWTPLHWASKVQLYI